MSSGRFARALIGGILGVVTIWTPSTPALAAEDPFAAMRATRVAPPASAPDLVLPTVNGGSLRLGELRGKAVILGFFVTT